MMKRLAVVLGALALASCVDRVPAGSVGLYVYAGSGLDPHLLKEGLYWHAPWTHMVLFAAQWNELEEKIDILTKDDVHLTVQAGIAIRPNVAELYQLQQELGVHYYDTIVQSAFFTATRTVLAGFDMTDIPENSEKIEREIRAHVAERIAGRHLELGNIALQHIDYPAVVQAAIENRLVVQQQQTQKEAEIKIAQADSEISRIRALSMAETEKVAAAADADAATVRAGGESKAQELLAKTLTPLLVQLRALTSPTSKLVFVPEGKQLSVVLGSGATALDGAAGAAH